MQSDFYSSVSNAGVLKLEVTAEDLMVVLKKVASETANNLLAEMNKERIPEFVPTRKEAMKMLNVTTALRMIRWEEKGYLNPFRIGGRIFYRKDEVISAFENSEREEV